MFNIDDSLALKGVYKDHSADWIPRNETKAYMDFGWERFGWEDFSWGTIFSWEKISWDKFSWENLAEFLELNGLENKTTLSKDGLIMEKCSPKDLIFNIE